MLYSVEDDLSAIVPRSHPQSLLALVGLTRSRRVPPRRPPEQFLVDDSSGRLMLNDFNRVHVMSKDPTGGKYCPLESPRRRRHIPWPSPENYAGELQRLAPTVGIAAGSTTIWLFTRRSTYLLWEGP